LRPDFFRDDWIPGAATASALFSEVFEVKMEVGILPGALEFISNLLHIHLLFRFQ
jgi:hypothetical protein